MVTRLAYLYNLNVIATRKKNTASPVLVQYGETWNSMNKRKAIMKALPK